MISVSKAIATNRSCNVCLAQNYVSPLCNKDRKQDIYELTVERMRIALCAKCLKAVGTCIDSFLKENKSDGDENCI